MPVLRIYWYDGAPDALPSADHLEIGHLRDVKLRLGRLSGGKQKGVDSLIIRDLMTLARERAIATAYLLSGDEDVREGVVAAQDMGVRVVLLGIPPTNQRRNQAATLMREADAHVVLTENFWTRFFQRSPEPSEETATPAVADPLEAVKLIGTNLGQRWAAGAKPEERFELLGRAPWLPRPLDTQLLREAQAQVGDLSQRDELRNAARAAFWEALRSASDPQGTEE
jgi:hypothetical protein